MHVATMFDGPLKGRWLPQLAGCHAVFSGDQPERLLLTSCIWWAPASSCQPASGAAQPLHDVHDYYALPIEALGGCIDISLLIYAVAKALVWHKP
jgi:hypothetical protein